MFLLRDGRFIEVAKHETLKTEALVDVLGSLRRSILALLMIVHAAT